MAISLATRAARACAAATLVFFVGLAPSHARMGGPGGAPIGRPASGFSRSQHFAHPGLGRSPHFALHGFTGRFDAGRFGFNRIGHNRFDRFDFNRFHRFGFHRFGANQLFVGGWGWGGWGGAVPVSTGAEPILTGGGAPIIINIATDQGFAAAGGSGGCVTHKLIYDGDGNYVGERQSSQC